MKKLIFIAIFSFFMANNIFAESWTVCHGYPKGPGAYKTVTMGGSSEGGWSMECDGDGDNDCCWGVTGWDEVGLVISQNQVDQRIAAEIGIGNLSGQIYNDGTRGNYTIQTVSQDATGRPCFLWKVGYDANNNQTVTIMVTSE
jgi:hypothetical protein